MGRPSGTLSETERIARSKSAWNATADKARKGLDLIADKILAQIADDTVQVTDAATTLRDVAIAATRVTESLTKAEKAYAEAPEPVETAEAIMEDLAGGRG